MTRSIAIIGDRFMLPSLFEEAMRGIAATRSTSARCELPWPDEPMEHGYARPGMDGLKEYHGRARRDRRLHRRCADRW